jgi:hypothetical protein
MPTPVAAVADVDGRRRPSSSVVVGRRPLTGVDGWGLEGWRDGGMGAGGLEGWRDGRMEGWTDGRMEGCPGEEFEYLQVCQTLLEVSH